MIIEILRDNTKDKRPYVCEIWTMQTSYICGDNEIGWELFFEGCDISFSKSYEKLLTFAQRLSQLKSNGCNRVTIDYVNMELGFCFETSQDKEPIDL